MIDFIVVLSCFMWYSLIHFIIISFWKNYEARTQYEKFITWVGIALLPCIFAALMDL